MNRTGISTEEWFIPLDILMMISTILIIFLSMIFFLIILFDKRCHTVLMMFIENSCLSAFIFGSILLSMSIFTLKNDLEQIQFEDSLCLIRTYLNYVSTVLFYYSFVSQAFHRYLTVIHSNRLFFQSIKCSCLILFIQWLFSFLCPLPFLFNDQIRYNIDNQICQTPLRFSWIIIYCALCSYGFPLTIIMLIYWRIVRYVRQMHQRVTPVNILSRAEKEVQMIRRIVIQINILLILGLPYGIFAIISFFTSPPKYHFRISFLFIDMATLVTMLMLLKFTDPLKTSILKGFKRASNRILPLPNT